MLKKWISFVIAGFLSINLVLIVIALSGFQIIGSGSPVDALVHPAGACIHKNSLFVCDPAQSRVLVFDIRTKKHLSSFGSFGNSSNHLRDPQGICVDSNGNIYISQKDQIIKLDEQYRFLGSFDLPGKFLDIKFRDNKLWVCNYDENEILILDSNTLKVSSRFATGLGPVSLDFNSTGELLVSETGENRISFYSDKGIRLRNPLILGKNSIIDGLAVGPNDWIFLHDSFYYQIHAYSKGGGSKLREFDVPGNTVRCWTPGFNSLLVRNDLLFFSSVISQELLVYTDMGVFREAYGRKHEAKELLYPRSLTIIDEQIHITDTYAGGVKRFSLQGSFLGSYGVQSGRGRMDFPTGIDITSQGHTIVLNAHSNILFFDLKGQFQKELTVQVPLNCASDLAVHNNTIYIADTGNKRIVLLDSAGRLLKAIEGFIKPKHIFLSSDETLYVSDQGDASIKIFQGGKLVQTLRHANMKLPAGLCLSDHQVLTVTDLQTHQIHLFSQVSGQYLYARSFGEMGGPKAGDPLPGTYIIDYNKNPGFFLFPEDVYFDGQFFYVTDRMNQRVQRIAKGLLLDNLQLPVEEDIIAEPSRLDFGRVKAGDPAIKELSLKKTGSIDIEGTLSSNQSWIRIARKNFQGDTRINVSIDTLNLTQGEHIGDITIESNLRKLVLPVTIFIERGDPADPPQPPDEEKEITIELQINNPKAKINGKELWIDSTNPSVVPLILPPGRTFVPIRFISEAFGAEVQWDGSTRTVRIYLEAKDVRVTLQIDNKTARINQNIVNLDAAPQILNGRTMVPLRFIAEAFSAQVLWDAAEQRITIVLSL
jgi:DNA-binding beta-propeller fold protein YncE